MTIRFKIYAGQNYLGTVASVKAVHGGVWLARDRALLKPDTVALWNIIPYRWRKGFARSAGQFAFASGATFGCHGKDLDPTGSLELFDLQGEHMAALIAVPFEV